MNHRTALEHALRVVNLRLREIGDPSADHPPGDLADAVSTREAHEHQVLGHAGLVERRRLILAAQAKLGTDAEGRCEDCGSVIPGKRLAAIPWCTHCLLCQSRSEEADARTPEPPRIAPPSDDAQG